MKNNKVNIEKLYELLHIYDYQTLKELSKKIGISISKLQYYITII